MRTPLASVAQLADHTSVAIATDEAVALAQSMLVAASARVRAAGSDTWEDFDAPDIAIAVTLDAAARGFLNPAGYQTERGNMVTIIRGDSATEGVALTAGEEELCRVAAGGTGLGVVKINRNDIVSDAYYWWNSDAPLTFA